MLMLDIQDKMEKTTWWKVPYKEAKDVVLWWKASMEGQNGTSSGRRMSAMFLTFLYAYGRVSFMQKITDPDKLLLGSCLDVIFIGLLWGYVNFQNLVELRNGYRKTTETKTTETLEKVDGNGNSNSNQ